MQLRGGVEEHLGALGFTCARRRRKRTCAAARPAPIRCCSPSCRCSLRERKLGHLLGERAAERPAAILSANIGCITHLQAGTELPVRHWVERWTRR
jgi:glycolate oxidase iron-sulfur subunit